MQPIKERLIFLSAEMVQAIFNGRKGQTRRVKKGDKCPYGKVGDHLWVKETWASRILLEITDIRVERLNDISEADAIAEGCDYSKSEAALEIGWYEKPVRAFRRIWEQNNSSYPWGLNPWIWVIEFKVLEQVK